MNREDAKDTKEEPPQGGKEEDSVLPSRSSRLRGLIIPMQLIKVVQKAPQ